MINQYGIQIRNNSDQLIIDQTGILQIWSDTVTDYCQKTSTKNYPLILYVNIPNNTINIQAFELHIKSTLFRQYIDSIASMSITLSADAQKHNHQLNGSISVLDHTSKSVTGSVDGHDFSDDYYEYPKDHSHSIKVTGSLDGSHTHLPKPHTHPVNPKITEIGGDIAPDLTSLNGTITYVNTPSIIETLIFSRTGDNFTLNNNLVNYFYNGEQLRRGWYKISVSLGNNTTKKLYATYVIKGMNGVTINE
jgi:hypothetical protein